MKHLKFDRVRAGVNGSVNHGYGHTGVAVMVYANLRYDEHRFARTNHAITNSYSRRACLVTKER